MQKTNITKRKKMTRKKRRITIVLVLFAVFLLVDAGVFIHKKIVEKRESTFIRGEIENNQADKKKTDENGQEVIIRGKTNIYIVDVGLGEAIIVDHGENEALIDGGNAEASSQVTDLLKTCVDGNLEYVINTDCKANRCGGLSAVYDQFKVDNTIYARKPASADSDEDSQAFDAFYAKAKQKCDIVKEGDTSNYSLGGGAMFTLISTEDSDIENSKKLSCAVTYGGKKMLVLGNADSERMNVIAADSGATDVLVAGQNGGFQSMNKSALDKLYPQYLIISSNSPQENNNAYPSTDTMQILEEASKDAYATYRSGTIFFSFSSDGNISTSIGKSQEETIRLEDY